MDSRELAQRLGVKHKNTIELLDKHKADFLELGVLPFQTEKPSGPNGGRPERFALLNEDQASHDALRGLAPDRQRQQHLHVNVNKLLNKVAGLDAGQRHGAQPGSLSVLAVGQMLAAQAATGASDDKAAYARIKQALKPLHSLAKPQLLEVAQ